MTLPPFPKMFKIASDEDIETDSQYAYVKLLTGQKVRLSREIVRKMYEAIVRRDGVVIPREWVQTAAEQESIDSHVEWPKGTLNPPIWVTSDNRNIPVTKMEDSHIENSIHYFTQRLAELAEDRGDIIDMEGFQSYRERRKKASTRLDIVKKELRRRRGK